MDSSVNNRRLVASGRMHWRLIALLVCLYGFSKEFRPVMPFLTPFLQSPAKNFTSEELYGDVFPYWTYSFLVFSVPVFFLIDWVRYKPIVVLEALMLTCTWGIFVWGTTVWQMLLAYLLYGVASASETAYYSYLYAVVDKKHYKTVTSYTRTAVMLGQCVAYTAGQVVVTAKWIDFTYLNYFSFGAEFFALTVALIIPSVKKKVDEIEIDPESGTSYGATTSSSDATSSSSLDTMESDEAAKSPVKSPEKNGEAGLDEVVVNELEAIAEAEVKIPEKNKNYIEELRIIVPIIMKNRVVITWSLWWILTSGLISQLYNYAQILWSDMQQDPSDIYNGVVASVNTAGGAAITFSLQYLPFKWEKHGEVVSLVTSVAFAGLFYAMSVIHNLYIQYVLYLCACYIYAVLITVAMSVIASQLDSQSYGLVFGVNTFVATLLQAVLTFIVVDTHGLNLRIRSQFEVYAGCFVILAAFFFAVRIQKCFRRRRAETSA